MELKTGYKQTEVGVIPSDWSIAKVHELGEVKRGAGSQYTMYAPESNGIRFIRINDFFENNPVFVQPTSNMMRFCIHQDDILFAGTGNSAGASFIPPKDWIGLPFSYNAPRIRTNKKTTKQFLLYCLQSGYLLGQQKSLFVGAAQPFLDTKAIANFDVALPPTLAEQTAIATALSDTDQYITHLEKLIAKKRGIKQGAMQELLKPKEGWMVKKLGEIADVIGGGTPSTFITHYWNGTINWFTPTEIGVEKYATESIRKITKEGLSSCSARILPAGAILLTTRAGIGDASILKFEGCTNQGFQSLVAKQGYDHEYLYYVILTLKNTLLQNASGSTFLEISPKKIKQIEISIPELKEQTRIATILSDMDSEITTLETKLSKAKSIKQGMMQQLLTGKIRLV